MFRMKSAKLPLLVGALFAASAALQAAPVPQTAKSGESSEGSLASGMAINATLKSSIDTKKVKTGDPVVAETSEAVKSSDGRTILPKGTKLMGHVTQASSRAKGDNESVLAIQFEKAVPKHGEEMPLNNLMIQAMAPPATGAPGYSPEPSGPSGGTTSSNPSMSGSSGGARTGSSTTGSNPSNPYPGTAGQAGQTEAGGGEQNGPLPPNARGIYGMQGLNLGRANAGNAESSVIVSSEKNVHLDSGTRLLLVMQPQGGSASTPGR